MASQQIDKAWDGWMQALSDSYVKVSDLIKQQKTADAAKEFQDGFNKTVVTLYEQVASAPPKRFAKLGDEGWSAWARGLYIKTRQAGDAFKPEKKADPAQKLDALRAHFLTLHQKAGTVNSNDAICAFYQETMAKAPQAEALGKLAAEIENAAPSAKAKAQPEAYAKSKTEWKQAADAALQGGKLNQDELGRLRQATEKFYSQFGIQFE